ncbi:nitric oxide reductase transcription regulator [Pseudohongiella acticola]|uniref:Nitric oxide reductase transcription regulator n=1 Tax=Pseudohongiella acticola TaxID=1524254 RepID=A0A1E8CFX0_9GAMM|nr:nitric oxide reductase transcriptional regulator NorR [Pseudohongiella acticola]OFE11348.1 nitric oxide reductase transcription regulator [Pseudohongiella acticola]
MTTRHMPDAVLEILADLSRELTPGERYTRLLQALSRVFPCDAAALLQLHGGTLQPLAIQGLSDDTMGRSFMVDDHPRLAKILLSREPVRFMADSQLPDPYDGLVDSDSLHVHDCLGASLYIDDMPWGLLTLDAMRPGAFDEIDPYDLRTFLRLAEATIKIVNLIGGLRARVEREHLVTQAVVAEQVQLELTGHSKVMQILRHEIDVVALTDLAVLITGETGVGKELVARHIHAGSSRAQSPLVYVNCAALPDNLVESELFGHTQGAFSGASQARAGKFELAHGGTLFLDEVGELPLATQPKLLRALQNGDVQRVGSDVQHKVDVRIIAATNRDLAREVAAGHFRADLYHRLSVYPIEVPPLRSRQRDVLTLAGHFLEMNRRRLGLRGIRLQSAARDALLAYDWPGNVRELEHLISRAALRARASETGISDTRRLLTITCDVLDLPDSVSQATITLPPSVPPDTKPGLTLRQATEMFQKDMVTNALRQCDGNQSQAARALGLDRGNLSRLLKRLGL